MNAHELPNGNLLVPKHPKAPGPSGDKPEEIGPDHPEWGYWSDLAEREAVHGAWQRVRTLEEVETAERAVERYAERHAGMVDQSDAAIAREMLKMQRRSIELYGEDE